MKKLARNSRVWVCIPLLTASLMAWLREWSVAILVAATFVFMVFFHRDPDRTPSGPGMISPADGLVVVASPDLVAIFMSYHNVHVNRSPLEGQVKSVEHMRGGHAPAFLGSSHQNEQNVVVIDTPDGEIRLSQISGFMVRRIICYVVPGDRIRSGERIGMIRFGSRVEFTIPEGYRLTVCKGDKVKAGETVVAVKA